MKNKNEVAVVNDVLDIPTMLQALKAELSKLNQEFDGDFKRSTKYNGVELTTCNDIRTLISMGASVKARAEHYNQYAQTLGLTEYPAFEIDGGDENSWNYNIQKRIALVTHESKRKELEADIKEMESFLSEEDKKKAATAKMIAKYGTTGLAKLLDA
jgi:hypothetical protein